MFGTDELSFNNVTKIPMKGQGEACVLMFHADKVPSHNNLSSKLFEYLTDDSLFSLLSDFQFSSGKLPPQGKFTPPVPRWGCKDLVCPL